MSLTSDIVWRYIRSDLPSREIGVIADEMGVTAPDVMRIMERGGFKFIRTTKKYKVKKNQPDGVDCTAD